MKRLEVYPRRLRASSFLLVFNWERGGASWRIVGSSQGGEIWMQSSGLYMPHGILGSYIKCRRVRTPRSQVGSLAAVLVRSGYQKCPLALRRRKDIR